MDIIANVGVKLQLLVESPMPLLSLKAARAMFLLVYFTAYSIITGHFFL